MEEIADLCEGTGLPAAVPLIRKFADQRPDVAAASLLERLRERSVQVQTVHCNSVLGALKRARHWQHALWMFQLLPQFQLHPDGVSFNTLLSACSSAGRWDMALRLFSSMRQEMIEADRISYNAAIDACAKAMQWQRALHFFHQMEGKLILPNAVTLASVLSACDKGAQWPKAMALLSEAWRSTPMSLDVALYNSIFNILGKMSQWQDCLAGLQEMPLLRLRPNQISYVAAMTACSRGSHWAQACDLLKMMAAHTTPPNVISHNAALNALSSAKLWQRCLEMMESLEITWDSVSYCTTIGACGNAGNWQVVLLLLEQMRVPGTRPCLDRTVLDAGITACGRAEQWRMALHLLRQMPSKWTISPDEVSYNAAISACENGPWQHALELATEMWGATSAGLLPEITLGALSAAMRWAPWNACLALLGSMLDLHVMPSGICVGNLLRPLQETLGKEVGLEVLRDIQSFWAASPGSENSDVAGTPSSIGFSVLRASPGLLAVAKPGGVSTERVQELVSAALNAPLQLVSRLDLPTSGVLPLARSRGAELLRAQFTAGLVEKEYWCLCSGKAAVSSGTISKPLLVRHSSFNSLYAEVSDAGREARSDYQVAEVYEDEKSFPLTLMRVKPFTGRTHQIRAHMASIGLGIVGDPIYGQPELFPWCPRLFLHCRRLCLMDFDGQETVIEAPLPSDLREALRS